MSQCITLTIRRAPVLFLVPLCLGLAACAALDEASVGRTDRLRDAAFYVSYRQPANHGPVVVVPVALDPESGEPFNLAGRGAALQPLLGALNASLATHECCRYAASHTLPAVGGPVVYLGMLDGETAPAGTGIEREFHAEYSPMILHSIKPNATWRAAVVALAEQHQASHILLVQLAFTQFPKADRGYFGKKVVLGTNYEVPVRFFSSVDGPIEVIALTGALFDANGNLVRAGGEGIAGYDTPFWVQVFKTGKEIDTTAINELVNSDRREDLPGQPLKWQAALDQLLRQMTGPA
ncbi:MAG TPA: hypothetical protein VK854_11105 [Woeseiaceae bacterium]|nr:hypothetical protein [Woeseiaceae bacterium]